MSSDLEYTTLGDFPDQRYEEPTDAEWQWIAANVEAGMLDSQTCRACGASVSKKFSKLFGDRDGNIHACFSCVPKVDVLHGAAADADFARRCQEDIEPYRSTGVLNE